MDLYWEPLIPFWDGNYSGRCWRLDPGLKKWRHICCHFLLLRAKLEHLNINQSLKNVFENVTTLGRVPQILWYKQKLGLSVLSTSSGHLALGSFSLLLLLSNLNNESICSSLKEYCLLARGWFEELPPLAGWGLEGDFVSTVSVSFLVYWKDVSGVRLVDFSGLSLFSFALTLATISSACSPC